MLLPRGHATQPRGIFSINALESPLRYANTLRYLRTSQWWWLFRYRVLPAKQAAPRPKNILWDEPLIARLVRYLDRVHEVRPLPEAVITALSKGELSFFGEPALARDSITWIHPEQSRLWHYHLHYFDWMADLAASAGDQDEARDQAECWCTHWIEANPPGTDVAWDAYPTSKRVVNWILAAARWPSLRPVLAESLGQQVEYLAHHVEYDLQANHLFTNSVALTLAGAALGLPRINKKGASLLERQLVEQILDDGGHYERSPMYHAEILRDLALLHMALAEHAESWRAKTIAMTRYLRGILHDDGQIPLFGDAAEDPRWPGRDVVALASKAARVPFREQEGSIDFPATGVYCMKSPAGSVVWIKAAGVSPHHQPGHTHCDMLSYEYDLDGMRVIVDSGTHGYADSPYREFNRSTRAHNTVMLNGVEQHECWSTFRVARRGDCRVLAWEPTWAIPFLAARCHNYLGGDFTRVVAMPVGGGLAVADGVATDIGNSLTSWIHFHPQWEAALEETSPSSGHLIRLQSGEQYLSLFLFGYDGVEICRGSMAPVQGWYSPRMGSAEASAALVLTASGKSAACVGYVLVPAAGEKGAAELWQAVSQLHDTLATST